MCRGTECTLWAAGAHFVLDASPSRYCGLLKTVDQQQLQVSHLPHNERTVRTVPRPPTFHTYITYITYVSQHCPSNVQQQTMSVVGHSRVPKAPETKVGQCCNIWPTVHIFTG